MAAELSVLGATTGSTIYAIVRRNSDKLVWSTVADDFVTFVNSDYANYDLALTETPASSKFWVGNLPSACVDTMVVIAYYTQAGASPAITDVLLGGTTDTNGVNVKAWAGTDVLLASNGTTTKPTVYASILTNGITAASLAEDAGAEIADAVWDEALSGHVAAGTAGKALAYADVAVSSRATAADVASTIAGATNVVVIAGPVSGDLVTVTKGDSYSASDAQRRIQWTNTTGAPWPTDLTGWTITFTARKSTANTTTGDATFTVGGTVVTPTGTQVVRLSDITSLSTSTLAVGNGDKGYVWDLEASLASGAQRATLRSGVMSVRDQQTRT
jgi:hypothetical protein